MSSQVLAETLRVDLNPKDVRAIAVSRHAENWNVAEAASLTQSFGSLTLSFKADQGGLLMPITYKPTLDFYAPMAADGLTLKKGGTGGFDMIIHGLKPGRHTLTTFHTGYEETPAKIDISVGGVVVAKDFQPTSRVTHDDDLAAAYFTVLAEEGKDVVVHFQAAAGFAGQPFVLNGFEVDGIDPHQRALKPAPADEDYHWTNEEALTWTAASSALSHRVYLGTDMAAVAAATPSSPECKGEQKDTRFPLPVLSNLKDYYWRVDEVDANNQVTRGDVWHFRVRHLAFPTAEGYGRFAIGGRGGQVIEVTNLEDYDTGKKEAVIPGSFRAAVEADFPRTIVFRVSGIIRLKKPCAVHNPFCTIAGQTAPGDGICLANYSSGGFGTHDLIIRYMHFRIGDAADKAMDGSGLSSCDHAIMDHCSISWSSDEGTSSRNAHNITFQRNIVAEALHHGPHYNAKDRSKKETHAFAGSISGDIGSYHHNLLADCTDRNWSLAGGLNQAGKYAGRLDIRNNVVYNWTARTTDGGVRELNYVNNYYKPYKWNPFVQWLLKLDEINPTWGTEHYYMDGNVLEGYVDEKHNWEAFYNGRKLEKEVRVDQELYPSYVKTQSAKEAYVDVLANVGANFPKSDVVDLHILKDVREGTAEYTGTRGPTFGDHPSKNFPGIIDTQTDDLSAKGSKNFPWPDYKTYKVPVDTDHDGIPDDWEIAHGLNPKDPSDANKDANGDGYTNLEKYINSLVGEYKF